MTAIAPRPWILGLLLAATLGLSLQARAQATETPEARNAALRQCLVKPTEPLKYPEQELERRFSGSFKARLTFTRADRSPRVERLSWSGTEEMAEDADLYLRGYRLPCLPPGEQATFDQEVVFSALGSKDDEKKSAPRTAGTWDCLRMPAPFSYHETMQTGTNIKQKERGNVLLELSFDAPDKPPRVKELYNSAPHSFKLAVIDHMGQYRLPCMKPGDEPMTTRQLYIFRGVADSSGLVLRDMGLVAFLRAVKDVDKVPVKFNLDSMACPFKVTFKLYQPAASNIVSAVGPDVPQRRPLLDWIETLALSIDKRQFEALLGAEMMITVPCGSIEL